jgi:hypothetical protein
MARGSYPEPVVPGKFSSWVTKKSTTERVQDCRMGQTRRPSRRLLGRLGPRRRCAADQTVPARRPGQDQEGPARRRLPRRPAIRSTAQAVHQLPWRSARLNKVAELPSLGAWPCTLPPLACTPPDRSTYISCDWPCPLAARVVLGVE